MPTLGLSLATFLLAPQCAVHLALWEQHARGVTNFRADFTLTRKDAVFQKERQYSGSLLGLPSGALRMRLGNAEDRSDYEAFISDGKSLYFYSGLEQSVTEVKLTPLPANPPAGAGAIGRLAWQLAVAIRPTEQFGFRAVSGATAKEAAKRFDVSLFKQDENYVYLEFRPRSPRDRMEMQSARVALYGPGVKPPYRPYTPAQVLVVRPHGDTENWKFTGVQVSVPGVNNTIFRFEEVPGYTHKQVPPDPVHIAPPPREVNR